MLYALNTRCNSHTLRRGQLIDAAADMRACSDDDSNDGGLAGAFQALMGQMLARKKAQEKRLKAAVLQVREEPACCRREGGRRRAAGEGTAAVLQVGASQP
jgi:hypothetical protein